MSLRGVQFRTSQPQSREDGRTVHVSTALTTAKKKTPT